MRGRKPIPTALKLLRGNPGKRPLNRDEPTPALEMPDPPALLEGEALAKWRELTALLAEAQILTRLERDALTVYCQTWAEWTAATRKLQKFGSVIKAPSGYPVQSPYVAIANQAKLHLRGLLADFGMTPSARARVSKATPKTAAGDRQRQRFFGVVRGKRDG